MSVHLGDFAAGRSQAQLGGFTSRAVRAQASVRRQQYATEWGALDVEGASGVGTLVTGDAALEVLKCGRRSVHVVRKEPASTIGGSGCGLVFATMSAQCAQLADTPLRALEVALSLVHGQAAELPAPVVQLLTMGAQVGRQPERADAWGLGRSARTEMPMPVPKA